MFKIIRLLKSVKFCTNHNVCSQTNSVNVSNRCSFRNCTTVTQVNEPNKGLKSESLQPDIFAITRGDPELTHKLKVIILEVDVMRQEAYNVPTYISTEEWSELLKLRTQNARSKYLTFLFKKEKTKENALLKKQKKAAERTLITRQPVNEDGHLVYNLSNNNIFLRIYNSKIDSYNNGKLFEAMMFGQKLIIDCGYDNDMTKRENTLCAKQLMLLFSENRYHDNPYDLHFCNTNLEGSTMKAFHKHIPTVFDLEFPLNIHEKSYLDIFPKEQLVYLTPHCKEQMSTYDHNAIYIIGGIVDKVNTQPLSLAKAKKERLRMQKLPLDRYLQWTGGSGKNLTLNQVTSILLDVRQTGDWKYALRHVPRRKIVDITKESSNVGESNQRSANKNLFRYNTVMKFNKNKNDNSFDKNSKKFSVRSIFNE